MTASLAVVNHILIVIYFMQNCRSPLSCNDASVFKNHFIYAGSTFFEL